MHRFVEVLTPVWQALSHWTISSTAQAQLLEVFFYRISLEILEIKLKTTKQNIKKMTKYYYVLQVILEFIILLLSLSEYKGYSHVQPGLAEKQLMTAFEDIHEVNDGLLFP